MRIGIIACEILKPEIERLTADDPEVVHREYLAMGLHDRPEELRDILVSKLNSLEGKADVVFVGYAICKSLNDIPKSIRVPMVMLREEDCIASMLGPLEYANERAKCPGTWYSSPGWAALGIDALVDDTQMEGLEELGYDKLYFAKKELEGYTRCLYIDTGTADNDQGERLARDMAETLGLCFERRGGEAKALKDAWRMVKEFDQNDKK